MTSKPKYEIVGINNIEVLADDTSAQLLTKLQQELDSVFGALSDTHIERYGYALYCIQSTIDHFNERLIDGCTQQVADILGFQLEEIREAAKKHHA